MTSKGIPLPEILTRAAYMVDSDRTLADREQYILLCLLESIAKACEEYSKDG